MGRFCRKHNTGAARLHEGVVPCDLDHLYHKVMPKNKRPAPRTSNNTRAADSGADIHADAQLMADMALEIAEREYEVGAGSELARE